MIGAGFVSKLAPPRAILQRRHRQDSSIAELVDITPHVSLLSKVGQSGHSVADAVAELVDNALDARVGGTVQVDVSYNLREGWLRVDDDGRGMSRRELSQALVLALSAKGGADIGRFGLGLKTACTSLGDRFVITTAPVDGAVGWAAEYDEEQFLMSGEWKMPVRRRKKHRPHGTTVSVESSRLYSGLQQSLERNLGWTFRHFLVDGVLKLTVNGIEVEPGEHAIDPESFMPFSGEVAGRSVRGWAGLLYKSSQRGWYGFALIRHRRIVRRHEKLGFQAHPSTARVVGEIHLDDFDTNNLKTDFIRETAMWRELEEWVSRTIEPVLAHSRALAHAGMLDLKIRARLDEQRREILGGDNDSGLRLPRLRDSEEGGDISRPVAVAVGSLHLEHVFASDGSEAPYVSINREARPDEADLIMVRSNLDHRAAGQISDRSGWACHNLAEAAALQLAAPQEFIALKGIVLQRLLDERALRRALTESARDFMRAPTPETAIAVDR